MIETEWLIVRNCLEGWKIFENDSEESDYMEDNVAYDCRNKSDVNETYDLHVVWNHSTRGDFLKW